MAVGGCIRIKYTGVQASCLLIGDATAKTLTSKIGALGAEANDAAFGTGGILDLTAAAVNTFAELVAVIDAYSTYSAEFVYGDDIPTENIVTLTCQAANAWGYVLFNYPSSVLSEYALTTWMRAKLYLSLADTDQLFAEYLINDATEKAEDIAKRKLKARVLTLYLDGDGTNTLLVSPYPINSVTGIWDDDQYLWGSETEILAADRRTYADEGMIILPDDTFGIGYQNIKLTFNGGFSPVPERLQSAVIEVVGWNIKRFRSSNIGLRSIASPDGLSTAFELEIPLNARHVFQSYRDKRL